MAAGAAVALSRQGRRGTLSDADAAAPRHRRLLRRRAAATGGAISDLFVLRTALPRAADDIARVHVETWQSTYAGLVHSEQLARMSVARSEPQWHRGAAQAGEGNDVIVAGDARTVGGSVHLGI